MAMTKGSKKKADQDAPKAVHGTEPAKPNEGTDEAQKSPEIGKEEIAEKDQWRHHATEESRIFKKGDPIPAGWTKTIMPK